MKTIIKILIGVFLIVSCEKEYDTPSIENGVTLIEATTSLNAVTAQLNSFEENIVTFSEDIWIEAYVVSSDKGGNFFKELILQDIPENPTVGIALQINENSLFERFPFGSKVFINLKNLSIGYQKGIIELGVNVENSIDSLSQFLVDDHIFRTGEVVEIIAKQIDLKSVKESNLCQYIMLNDMQFNSSVLEPTPKTYSGENSDNFDGFRPMFNCEEGIEIQLCTSTFANFSEITLPVGMGEIKGVLLRDFDDLHYVLKVNTPTEIGFSGASNCETTFFECKDVTLENATLIFEEDFETITNENLLNEEGWGNINVTGDERRWTDKKITNVDNRVLTISAFNTGLQPLNAWLVMPKITILGGEEVNLSFRLRTLFNNGDALKLWITNNYTGDILNSSWEQIELDLPRLSSNYVTFTKTISCIKGAVYVAFEYKGYDSIITSSYDIDDVKVYKMNIEK